MTPEQLFKTIGFVLLYLALVMTATTIIVNADSILDAVGLR